MGKEIIFNINNYCWSLNRISQAIPNLISALLIFLIGAILFLERKKVNNLIFFCLAAFSSIWLGSQGLIFLSRIDTVAEFWVKLGHISIILVPPTVLFFALSYLDIHKSKKVVVTLCYCLSAIFELFLLYTDFFISDIKEASWGYYPQYGYLNYPFLAFFFSMLIASLFYCNLHYKRTTSPTKKKRISFLGISTMIAYSASIDFLPGIGLPVYPMGGIFMLGFVFSNTYMVVKRKISSRSIAEAMLDTMPNTLIVTDIEGNIEKINQETLRILKMKKEDIIGKKVTNFLVGESPLNSANESFILKKERIHNFASKYKDKEGNLIPVDINASTLKDKGGILIGMVNVGKDMRDIIKLQEKVIESERLSLLGTMGVSVAHELKNPLASIKLGLFNIKELAENQSAKFLKNYRNINSEINRATKIINDMLIFSRRSSLKPDIEKIDINKVVNKILKEKSDSLTTGNIILEKFLRADIPLIDADRYKIKEVFDNLILNAIQAMPRGGVLKVATDIKKSDGCEWGEISIKDTGSGIPKKILEKVKEPFFSTKPRGVGLGLAICETILNAHKGQLLVESEVGKGSNFIVRLPVEKRDFFREPFLAKIEFKGRAL